jgi:predicted nucleotidyltransferase
MLFDLESGSDLATDVPFVRNYLNDVLLLLKQKAIPVVSIVLFGSAAKNDALQGTSDVDLIIVLQDEAEVVTKTEAKSIVQQVERKYGLSASRDLSILDTFIDHAGGNAHSCFICTKEDFLSGNGVKVFGLNPFEALFLNRIVLATIIGSARTVWGANLISKLLLPPPRYLDVIKAFFSFFSVSLLITVTYPIIRAPTSQAMGVLKRALHSCYFYVHQKTLSLQEEVGFFSQGSGKRSALHDLLDLRRSYKESFSFVIRIIPLLIKLHWKTLMNKQFQLRS